MGIKIFLIIFGAILFLLIVCNIKIVPQSQVKIIERLGAYHTTWKEGLHIKIPFIDQIVKTISLKEQVIDFPPQPVITKDNVTMQIDSVVFFKVMDPKLYTYGIERPISAIENLTATTLRNIIGELDLDNTLTSRDTINIKITSILDQATDQWGIKITRVELKNIMPPASIQEAMEKQMKAERERREIILQSEGQKKAAILDAEGRKEAALLNAEAEKQATILRAEAIKEEKIRIAQGEAESIKMVNDAMAESLKKLNEANPSKAVLTLKSFEAFEKVADGQATKIIIPSEIQNLAGLATSLTEVSNNKK